jgi:hypothetical protein
VVLKLLTHVAVRTTTTAMVLVVSRNMNPKRMVFVQDAPSVVSEEEGVADLLIDAAQPMMMMMTAA